MKVTQESVKAWLAEHPDRDREWLASQCGAEKSTVDNWLSTARGIPAKAVLIIESLMRKDAEVSPQPPVEMVNLPVTCRPDQFDRYTRAYKQSECDLFRDWITSRLDAKADAELRQSEGTTAPGKGGPAAMPDLPQAAQASA
jgi:hypothetical protein